MRVGFDLDNTLIPQGKDFPVEVAVPLLPLKLWFREPLRVGTRRLLRALAADGCELWIYTTSARDPAHLRLWFLRLGGVLNWHTHNKLQRAGHCPSCSKYPPAFGIDLLIDDSEGVAAEGRAHGFDVLVISPSDEGWDERIRAAVKQRR